jgi:uncharacterized membrane protein
MEMLAFVILVPLGLVFLLGPLLGTIAFFTLGSLRRRLDRIEERLCALSDPPEFDRHPLRAEPMAEGVNEPVPVLRAVEVVAPTAPKRDPERPQKAPSEPFAWESLLGGRVLGWVAAAFLLLAFGYFIAYAFQNEWIGPVGQISLGLATGTLLCLAGARVHRRGYMMGAMLLGTGIVMLYLALLASYGGYQLLPPSRGVLYQMLLVALSVGVAGLYRTRSIAVMALVGGLVSPILIPSTQDLYSSFFLYLLLLETAMIVLSLWRGWTWLPPVALVGVQVLFGLWAEGNYHPEKLWAVLGFQAVLFALHLLHDVGVPVLWRQPVGFGRLLGLVVATLAFAQAVCVYPYWDIRLWLPALSLGMATLMVLLARLVKQRVSFDPQPLYFTLLALGLVFVAAAPALRFTGGWIGLAWAVLGLLLWAYALRVRALPLLAFAGLLLGLAIVHELFVYANPTFYKRWVVFPLFNAEAFPLLLVIFALWLAAWQLRVVQGTADAFRWRVWLFLVVVGIVVGWLLLSAEVNHYFQQLGGDSVLTSMSVSITWAIYAGLVMAAGFWRSSGTLRAIGLGLLGLAIVKGLLFDMASLSGLYRILAFLILAIVLGATAMTYQRLERAGLLRTGPSS